MPLFGMLLKSGSTYIWIFLAVAAFGVYSYIQILESRNETLSLNVETLERNIIQNKKESEAKFKSIHFNAGVKAKKESIEKELKKDETNFNSIDSTYIFL